MSSYIPPYRRSQAAGSSALDAPANPIASANSLYRNGHHGQGDVKQRDEQHKSSCGEAFRGRRGSNRGGFSRRYRPERRNIGDADIIYGHDITRYFWPQDNDEIEPRLNPSTFYGSTSRRDQLSYMLLFIGANPRWGNDSIVFAKRALKLLPDYTEQKLKSGAWGLSVRSKKARSEETTPQDTNQVQADRLNDEASRATARDLNSVNTEEPTQSRGQLSINDVSVEYEANAQEKTTAQSSITDSSYEEAAPSAPPSPSAIRTVPASEFYTDITNPTYPSIPPIDYKPGPHSPVAVFQEVKSISKNAFVFIGWHSVSRVNIIAPHSAELVRMQQQKWERQDRFGNVTTITRPRDASAWQSSLNHEWAVVKFEKLGNKVAPPKPEIEKTAAPLANRDANPGKSVTEMLEDIRLTDGTVHVGIPRDPEGK